MKIGIVYEHHSTWFIELLQKDTLVTINNKNIQSLSNELFQARNGWSRPFKGKILVKTEQNHNLRKITEINENNVKSLYYGTDIFN